MVYFNSEIMVEHTSNGPNSMILAESRLLVSVKSEFSRLLWSNQDRWKRSLENNQQAGTEFILAKLGRGQCTRLTSSHCVSVFVIITCGFLLGLCIKKKNRIKNFVVNFVNRYVNPVDNLGRHRKTSIYLIANKGHA